MPNLSYNKLPYNDVIHCLIEPTKAASWKVNNKVNWYSFPCVSSEGIVTVMPNKQLMNIVEVAILGSTRKVCRFDFHKAGVGQQVRESVFQDIVSSSTLVKTDPPLPLKVLVKQKELVVEQLGFTSYLEYRKHWQQGIPYTVASRQSLAAFSFFRNFVLKPMPLLDKD